MNRFLTLATGTALVAALAACAPPPETGSPGAGSSTGISQAEGERACRDALIDFHNGGDVRIVSSEPYQGGGRFVRGSVLTNSQTGGRELYQCIAYGDGSTGEISYLGEDTDVAQARPAVGSETDLTAFEGARAGQAEGGIMALGYEAIRSEGLTTYWFNRSTGACAEVTTSNGRYSSVTMLPAEEC